MSELVKIVVVVILAVLAGTLSLFELTGANGPGASRVGAWTVWKAPGDPDALPHTRLHFLLQGRLPPSRFLVSHFAARMDDDGRALDASCRYAIEGKLPPARWWTLMILPENAEAQKPAASLSAQDAMVAPDGTIRVRIGRFLRPGNWLQPPKEGTFRIVLALYGISPLQRERLGRLTLPHVRREGCS